jgi:hypothetical protein
MLNFVVDQRGKGPVEKPVLAILLDYYFLYVLSLLSLRIWRDGDPNANLTRLTSLVHQLQGGEGSGQKFVDDAETLLIISTAHFELDDRCYDILLDRVRALDDAHQMTIAVGHAAALGSHLRYGFEATYNRDIKAMRDDNGVRLSLAGVVVTAPAVTSAPADDQAARAVIAEAVINGLSPARMRSSAHAAGGTRHLDERARGFPAAAHHRDELLLASSASAVDDATRRSRLLQLLPQHRAPSPTRCCSRSRGIVVTDPPRGARAATGADKRRDAGADADGLRADESDTVRQADARNRLRSPTAHVIRFPPR